MVSIVTAYTEKIFGQENIPGRVFLLSYDLSGKVFSFLCENNASLFCFLERSPNIFNVRTFGDPLESLCLSAEFYTLHCCHVIGY